MDPAGRGDPDPGAGRAGPLAGSGPRLAFGNVYADDAEPVRARREERTPDPLSLHYPSAGNRLHSLRVIRPAVEPAGAGAAGVDV